MASGSPSLVEKFRQHLSEYTIPVGLRKEKDADNKQLVFTALLKLAHKEEANPIRRKKLAVELSNALKSKDGTLENRAAELTKNKTFIEEYRRKEGRNHLLSGLTVLDIDFYKEHAATSDDEQANDLDSEQDKIQLNGELLQLPQLSGIADEDNQQISAINTELKNLDEISKSISANIANNKDTNALVRQYQEKQQYLREAIKRTRQQINFLAQHKALQPAGITSLIEQFGQLDINLNKASGAHYAKLLSKTADPAIMAREADFFYHYELNNRGRLCRVKCTDRNGNVLKWNEKVVVESLIRYQNDMLRQYRKEHGPNAYFEFFKITYNSDGSINKIRHLEPYAGIGNKTFSKGSAENKNYYTDKYLVPALKQHEDNQEKESKNPGIGGKAKDESARARFSQKQKPAETPENEPSPRP